MTVFVDELRRWPGAPPPFHRGSSHLTSDDEWELHRFAAMIGLKRAWFQDGRIPHYDLTPRRRRVALREGAVFVPAKEQARRRIADRQRGTG